MVKEKRIIKTRKPEADLMRNVEFPREEYVSLLKERRFNGLIKVITGARRTGKSYLMNNLFRRALLQEGVKEANIIQFAFDFDEDIDKLDSFFPEEPTKIPQKGNTYLVNAKKFRAYIQSKTNESEAFYLLLDEIQQLDNFVGTLNGYLAKENLDIYVTGSNSHLLSSDIATTFKGRSSLIQIHPLSFSEFFANLGQSKEEAWAEYILTGSLPIVAKMSTQQEKEEYLTLLDEETYLKDIIAHHNIFKTQELGECFSMFASMIGSPMNISKLVGTFLSREHKKIANQTISSYLDFFKDAFVLETARQYDIKGKNYIEQPFKVYFEDMGVRNARLHFGQMEESHLMENIIYNELLRRRYRVDIGRINVFEDSGRLDQRRKSIYEQKSLEVDFIATKGNEKLYIQSALYLPDEEKKRQEKRSLLAIRDSFPKIIVTKNGLKPYRDEDGIITIDLFDFLLCHDIREFL